MGQIPGHAPAGLLQSRRFSKRQLPALGWEQEDKTSELLSGRDGRAAPGPACVGVLCREGDRAAWSVCSSRRLSTRMGSAGGVAWVKSSVPCTDLPMGW